MKKSITTILSIALLLIGFSCQEEIQVNTELAQEEAVTTCLSNSMPAPRDYYAKGMLVWVKSEINKAIINDGSLSAANKRLYWSLAMAVAMQEDEYLYASSYSDNIQNGMANDTKDRYPFGDCKMGFDANFGIYKMNWFMIIKTNLFRNNGIAQSQYGYDSNPTAENLKVLIANKIAAPTSWLTMTWATIINKNPGFATSILVNAFKTWSTNEPTITGGTLCSATGTINKNGVSSIAINNFWAGHRSGLPPLTAGKPGTAAVVSCSNIYHEGKAGTTIPLSDVFNYYWSIRKSSAIIYTLYGDADFLTHNRRIAGVVKSI